MLPPLASLRDVLATVINDKCRQGHAVEGLRQKLDDLPAGYDAYEAFAHTLADLPLRDDWPFVEPSDWQGILAECDPARPTGAVAPIAPSDAAARARAGFLASCCGCILGKPLEVNPTLGEIRAAAEAVGDWPLSDYVSEAMLDRLGRRHSSWIDTTRGRISYVAADDDINYSVLGMLLMESRGLAMTQDDIRNAWMNHLPIAMTFGPERTTLVKAGLWSVCGAKPEAANWPDLWNPKEEFCGALIRADAYGYACPARPQLAAELAWRDGSFTHRRTGIYGEMFVAAAIALAYVARDGLELFAQAVRYVPQRSRFARDVRAALDDVAAARDWLDGYERITRRYDGKATHCHVYAEVGTLINTLRFAESVGDGICKQVAQGNDTDSFGCTGGAILGTFFGPGHLEQRWLDPFRDEIRTGLSFFFERSLSKVADRMAALPAKIAGDLAKQATAAASTPQKSHDAGAG